MLCIDKQCNRRTSDRSPAQSASTYYIGIERLLWGNTITELGCLFNILKDRLNFLPVNHGSGVGLSKLVY